MRAYWSAVGSHLGLAIFDVLFVAALSLAPLALGRLTPLILTPTIDYDYWAFMVNGQLSFFSMGSLATLMLICLHQKLPARATLFFGTLSIFLLLFLAFLVGVDPSLQRAMSWVGRSALSIYLSVLFMRIIAEAMKAVGPTDALAAGTAASKKTQQELANRMSGDRA